MTTVRTTFISELRRTPALWLWGVFIATLPFYAGKSGLPQPGNALLFLVFPLAIAGWDRRFPTPVMRLLRPLILFVLWTIAVNLGWMLVTGRPIYALMPTYYIFNAAVVFSALMLARRYGTLFLRTTTYAVLFDVFFQVVASFFYRTDLARGELFFNNPNQLGYWAVLAACLIALTQRPLALGTLKSSLGVTGCAYLAVLSASRAAVAGVAVLLIMLLFSNPRLIVLFIIVALGLVNLGGPLANAIDAAEIRTTEERDPDASFADVRNYTRIWKFKEYAILGAGEGDNKRFVPETAKFATEIHSSVGTLVFSYGIVGTLLFGVFFVRVLRGASTRALVMLVPVLAYSIAHQGLRFALFWVLLAVFVALKPVPRQARPHAA